MSPSFPTGSAPDGITTATYGGVLRIHHGSGTPVLLLHGLVLDGRSFAELIPYLGKRPLWIPDLRGHGQNPERCAYTWVDLVTDVAAIARRAETAVDVIGVSLGGILAVELALAHPLLIHSMCLLGAAVDGETPAARERADAFAGAIRAHGVEPLLPAVMQLFLGTVMTTDPLVAAVEAQVRQTGAAGALHCLAATTSRCDLRPRLPALTLPALCVWGAQDEAISAARCRDTAERLPRAASTEIPGAHHLVANECPELVGRCIRDWWTLHALA